MRTRHLGLLVFAAMVFSLAAGAGASATSRTAPEKPTVFQPAGNLINPVGNQLMISNETSLEELSPAVAYNSTRREYLAVWYNDRPGNDDIRAQRMAWDGKLLGHPFYVSAAGEGIDRRYPRVAYNSISDQYLVVWEHQEISSGYSILGRRVSGAGEVLDASDLEIRGAGINLYTPAKPAVAYAYTSDKYLVVWEETWHPLPINTSIVGQVVLATGALEGNLISISQDLGGYFRTNPDLAYNVERNEYLVAWEQLDPDANPELTDIYIRRVTGNGELLFPETTKIAFYTVSSTAPAVGAMPIQPDGQYIVVFEQQYSADDWDIQGVLISPDGVLQTNVDIATTGANESQPSVSACLRRNQYLVGWKQVPDQQLLLSNIAGRLVDLSGSLVGDPLYLNNVVANQPRLATGWLGDFMAVYEDTPLTPDSGIYGHLIGNRNYLPWVGKYQ